MMHHFLSLFTSIAFASELIISPIADPGFISSITNKPTQTFATLQTSINDRELSLPPSSPLLPPPHTPHILGISTQNNESSISGKRKKSLSIAFLGDSMTDTLGSDFAEFRHILQESHPSVTPVIYNYGVGATNIDYGIQRITNDYEYLGKKIPALAAVHPDVVVLESFAYNPFPEDNAINRHWLALAKACDTIRQHIPNARIIIAVSIAPNAQTFTDGAPGLSFTPAEKARKTQEIHSYLQSTIKFATGQGYPLIDAYTPSKNPDGDGNTLFINPHDHIHPSHEGRKLIARETVRILSQENIIAN